MAMGSPEEAVKFCPLVSIVILGGGLARQPAIAPRGLPLAALSCERDIVGPGRMWVEAQAVSVAAGASPARCSPQRPAPAPPAANPGRRRAGTPDAVFGAGYE
ncbi:hypothetical protein ACCO45_010387 [Purpureocillium lilacinum]